MLRRSGEHELLPTSLYKAQVLHHENRQESPRCNIRSHFIRHHCANSLLFRFPSLSVRHLHGNRTCGWGWSCSWRYLGCAFSTRIRICFREFLRPVIPCWHAEPSNQESQKPNKTRLDNRWGSLLSSMISFNSNIYLALDAQCRPSGTSA